MNKNKKSTITTENLINYTYTSLSRSSLHSLKLSSLNLSSFSSSSLINGELDYKAIGSSRCADFPWKNGIINPGVQSNLPPYNSFHCNTIKIPTKIKHVIRRHMPREVLRAIHPNVEVAIEMCLLFTTQLISTQFEEEAVNNIDRWKALKTEYLRKYFSTSPSSYKKIIKALETPLLNGAILECDYISIKGKKSYQYRFGQAYFKKGLVSYDLKTKEAIHLLRKHNEHLCNRAQSNPICRNLMTFYSTMILPTPEEILAEAKTLISKGYRNRNGRKLTFLNKHSKDHVKNHTELSFVEDAIKKFKYLTDNHVMIPRPGNSASGGRVVDSITLMPRWIRNLIKVDGMTLVECDFSCLHPNIAIALYKGTQEYITHEGLAIKLNIDLNIVKDQHLSFFNRTPKHMEKSPLYEYYNVTEPQMIKSIVDEKYKSTFKHTSTSRKLFAKEVEIMCDIITRLNRENIYVGYVYDALLCHPRNVQRLIEIMNSTALIHGVKTVAKASLSSQQRSLQDVGKGSRIAA
ncbi:MAG: hypothetical protein ABIN01_13930 [Ferruginibacter sp.]